MYFFSNSVASSCNAGWCAYPKQVYVIKKKPHTKKPIASFMVQKAINIQESCPQGFLA